MCSFYFMLTFAVQRAIYKKNTVLEKMCVLHYKMHQINVYIINIRIKIGKS